MNQLDHKQVSKGNPKSPPTADKFVQDNKASTWSTSLPGMSPALGSYHDHEEDHANPQVKSVLTRVKERAKRWGRTLSKKKEGDHGTPSWGVSLEDDDDVEDAEFLGAPMYESELAPDEVKETARQHPRADPVIPEKHVLANSVNPCAQQDINQASPTPEKSEPCDQGGKEKALSPTSNKTISETVSEKLAPAYATVSDTTNAIASKVKDLTISSSLTATAAPSTEYTATDKQA